ncbi:hypothetical protein ACWD4T_20450 [Streptomyces umbrinus]
MKHVMTTHHCTAPHAPGPSLRSTPGKGKSWADERDYRFAQFMASQLASVETIGCSAERRAFSGPAEVFEEWLALRALAEATGDDQHRTRIDSLGWALRCVAHGAWPNHPQWESDFHPAATTAPIDTLEPST